MFLRLKRVGDVLLIKYYDPKQYQMMKKNTISWGTMNRDIYKG